MGWVDEMNRNEMKIPEGAESGLLLDIPREHNWINEE